MLQRTVQLQSVADCIFNVSSCGFPTLLLFRTTFYDGSTLTTVKTSTNAESHTRMYAHKSSPSARSEMVNGTACCWRVWKVEPILSLALCRGVFGGTVCPLMRELNFWHDLRDTTTNSDSGNVWQCEKIKLNELSMCWRSPKYSHRHPSPPDGNRKIDLNP